MVPRVIVFRCTAYKLKKRIVFRIQRCNIEEEPFGNMGMLVGVSVIELIQPNHSG